MQRFFSIIFLTTLSFFTTAAIAKPHHHKNSVFEDRFAKWTQAFDRKDLTTVCQLFAKDVTASYQGYPVKNYHSLCDLFKKTFAETREYKYSFRVRHVYLSHDLAAVRVTWFLRTTEHGKLVSDTQDEGMDIFKKNKRGEWVIVNYLGYPRLAQHHAK